MDNNKHFVFISQPFWGHVKPLLGFILRLLQRGPSLSVTLILDAAQLDRVTPMLAGMLEDGGNQLPPRVQLVAFGNREDAWLRNAQEVVDIAKNVGQCLKSVYEDLILGRTFTDGTGRLIPSRSPLPEVVVSDYALSRSVPPILLEIEQRLSLKLKHYEFSSVSLLWMNWYLYDNCRPSHVGIYLEDLKRGMDPDRAFHQHIAHNDADLDMPGCGRLKCHEVLGANGSSLIMKLLAITEISRDSAKLFDGFIFAHSPYLSREAVKAWHKDQKLLLVGAAKERLDPKQPVGNGADMRLLEDALRDHGPRSVAYISFGSLFSGVTIEQIPIVIRALATRRKPSIWTLCNSPDEIKRALREANLVHGNGYVHLLDWTDQQEVLKHPAVGWFLTHGGMGGIHEGINAGLPMVFWPIAVDQIFNCSQSAHVEGLGIQLVQHRIAEKGKRTGTGVMIEASEEAISTELASAFAVMDSAQQSAKYRDVCCRLRDIMRREGEEGGAADINLQVVLELGSLNGTRLGRAALKQHT